MAGVNEMQTGQRLQTALAQRYGIQSPVSPALATELFPTIEVSSQGIDPELQFLQGTTLCVGLVLDPAVVAQESHVGLENPANSGVIAVVDQITINNQAGANQDFVLAIEGGALVASDANFSGWVRDSRYGEARRTVCQLVTLTGVVAPGTIVWSIRILNNSSATIEIPWVLAPQSRLWMFPVTSSQKAAEMGIIWRERPIEQWELTGAV